MVVIVEGKVLTQFENIPGRYKLGGVVEHFGMRDPTIRDAADRWPKTRLVLLLPLLRALHHRF